MKYIIDLPDGLGEGLMALVTGSDGMCMTRVERPASCWIPVSEGLPKKAGDYLVTIEYCGWHSKVDYILSSARYTKTYGWRLSRGRVIAWMPEPELYKEKQ